MKIKIAFDTKDLFHRKRLLVTIVAVVVFIGFNYYSFAGSIDNLKMFNAGDIVRSADINDNFNSLANAHDSLIGKISGMITFFAGTCPNGWSEYTAAQGRVIVGTFVNGTPGNTNLDDDATATATALNAAASKRMITKVPAHSHTLNGNTNNAGHGHSSITVQDGLGVSVYAPGGGDHLHSGGSGTSSGTTQNATAGGGAATNSIEVTMPYIQLTACQLTNP